MMQKQLIFSKFAFCLLLSIPAFCEENDGPILSIGGLVQSPMQLNLSDLQRFRQETVAAYEDAGQKGQKQRRYGTTTLRSLLELAKIQKPSPELVVLVKNHNREQVVLSWGEVFLSNRDRVFVAGSTASRDVELRRHLPALIVERGNTFHLCLKRISFVEVAALPSVSADSRKIDLPSALTEAPFETLGGSGSTANAGSLRGYSLKSVLQRAGIKPAPTDALKITSRSGGVAVASEGELRTDNAPVIVPHEGGGRERERAYDLLFARDSTRTRWLEDIVHIEIVNVKQKGMMYVVGVGCGDPNLLTNEAISIMGRADAFVGKEDYQKDFAGYIAGKPVLFDPFMQLARYQKAKRPELTDAEAEKIANAVYEADIKTLRGALVEGEIVALLEPGDPTLYGGWRNWLADYIPPDQLSVIAGMSSFSVANAVLGEYDITENPVIIAEPEDLGNNEALIQTAAKNGNIIVVFMGLNRIEGLASLLGKYFQQDTPVIIVYFAGIAGKERRMQTSLAKVIEDTKAAKEGFLGLVYVGKDLGERIRP
jgi:precorrin-2 methylase